MSKKKKKKHNAKKNIKQNKKRGTVAPAKKVIKKTAEKTGTQKAPKPAAKVQDAVKPAAKVQDAVKPAAKVQKVQKPEKGVGALLTFFREHVVVSVLLGLAAAFLIYVAVIQNGGLLDIVSWGFAAFAIGFALWTVIKESPIADTVRRILQFRPESIRFFEDPIYRSELMIYKGFFLNILYAGMKLVAAFFLLSSWYFALGVYYVCLCGLRSFLLKYVRRRNDDKSDMEAWKRYRTCGWLLFILNQVLTVLVIYMVHQGTGFVYPGVLIYAMAGYAFYAVTMSIVSLVRFRKFHNPIVSSAKIINLCAALVTMLALETAMLTQFGDRQGKFATAILMGSGGTVCVIVLIMAIGMILRGNREVKMLKAEASSTNIN